MPKHIQICLRGGDCKKREAKCAIVVSADEPCPSTQKPVPARGETLKKKGGETGDKGINFVGRGNRRISLRGFRNKYEPGGVDDKEYVQRRPGS